MSHPLVVHCQRAWYDIYVGRGPDPKTNRRPESSWGNPFVMESEADRAKVVAEYKRWLLSQPALVDRARAELVGKTLGCWCAPKECHGDILATIANSVPVPHEQRQCKGCDRGCYVCQGLFACMHCGGAEGALSSECPRVRVDSEDLELIYRGEKNYIAGEWVEKSVREGESTPAMPFWCGMSHVKTLDA